MTNRLIRALIVSCVLFMSSANIAGTQAQSNDPILVIRRQYAAINKRAARYRKVRKELSGFSLEGGELTAYFDGPLIAKIIARHYGEGGNTVEEFYYSQGKLIFVFEKVSHYDRPMSGKVLRTAQQRFYFKDDKLLLWIDEKGTRVSPGADGYTLKATELLQHSNAFTTAARSPKRVIEANE